MYYRVNCGFVARCLCARNESAEVSEMYPNLFWNTFHFQLASCTGHLDNLWHFFQQLRFHPRMALNIHALDVTGQSDIRINVHVFVRTFRMGDVFMIRKPPAKTAATLPPLDDLQRRRALEQMTLAHKLAWKYFQSCSRTVPLDDLYGEAQYALVYAAGMFNDTRGVPFGAYATMAISHRLIQAINNWRRGGPRAPVRFTDLMAHVQTEFDTPCPRTRESSDKAALNEAIERVRRRLPARWFRALDLYYAQGHTLEEVGQRLGVTRERVRQLLNKAVDRVRVGAVA